MAIISNANIGVGEKLGVAFPKVHSLIDNYNLLQQGSYNALDYGADPTGATSSSVAIQATVDAAYAAGYGSENQMYGGKVVIPAGTYLIDAGILLRSGVYIDIAKSAYFIFPVAYTGDMWYSNGKLIYCTVNGGMYYNNYTLGQNCNAIHLSTPTTDKRIQTNTFMNQRYYGFAIGLYVSGLNSWLTGNIFYNIYFDAVIKGIYDNGAANTFSGNLFDDITIQSTSSAVNSYGVYLNGWHNQLINIFTWDFHLVTAPIYTIYLTANAKYNYIQGGGFVATERDNVVNLGADNTIVSGSLEYSVVKTVKKRVGVFGVTGCDFNFAQGNNTNLQNIDLGAIVPARARIIQVEIVCAATIDSSDFNAQAGNASGGEQFIAAVSCDVANEVRGIIDAAKLPAIAMNWTTATNVWLGGQPITTVWDDITVGKLDVYVTYVLYNI